MTSIEFCESTGLTPRELQNWIENGLIQAELVVIPGAAGRYREFTAGQVERARVIKALHAKGVTLSRLATADLASDAGQAFVIFDGRELRACRDAKSAIAAVVRAKRWCSAVDLVAIREGLSNPDSLCISFDHGHQRANSWMSFGIWVPVVKIMPHSFNGASRYSEGFLMPACLSASSKTLGGIADSSFRQESQIWITPVRGSSSTRLLKR
jgi:DNA-binding transcriptional MerR regulator